MKRQRLKFYVVKTSDDSKFINESELKICSSCENDNEAAKIRRKIARNSIAANSFSNSSGILNKFINTTII